MVRPISEQDQLAHCLTEAEQVQYPFLEIPQLQYLDYHPHRSMNSDLVVAMLKGVVGEEEVTNHLEDEEEIAVDFETGHKVLDKEFFVRCTRINVYDAVVNIFYICYIGNWSEDISHNGRGAGVAGNSARGSFRDHPPDFSGNRNRYTFIDHSL